ncbi:MAG: hypothetical protein K8R18_05650 [Parvibaculum sp.]|uniref:hypothetical protein n=1 Tax=Parvibaculum sp. TaxID=2024848 RepID=UPI0025DE310C|nr:hypothetical protein [Parvibaculum sp.]MCE9649096.1 hypothetical protein [Parvibaculum sp.]
MKKNERETDRKAADAAKGGADNKTVKTVKQAHGDEKNLEKGRPKDTDRMGA